MSRPLVALAPYRRELSVVAVVVAIVAALGVVGGLREGEPRVRHAAVGDRVDLGDWLVTVQGASRSGDLTRVRLVARNTTRSPVPTDDLARLMAGVRTPVVLDQTIAACDPDVDVPFEAEAETTAGSVALVLSVPAKQAHDVLRSAHERPVRHLVVVDVPVTS